MSSTFTCARCGLTYPKGWSDEEAAAEAESLFAPAELEDTDVVCDDCFALLAPELPRLRAEIERDADAAGMSYEAFVRKAATGGT